MKKRDINKDLKSCGEKHHIKIRPRAIKMYKNAPSLKQLEVKSKKANIIAINKVRGRTVWWVRNSRVQADCRHGRSGSRPLL